MKVDNGKDHDVVPLNTVKHTIREFARNSPPNVTVDCLILQGIVRDPIQNRFDLGDKLPPQSGLLSFVPP